MERALQGMKRESQHGLNFSMHQQIGRLAVVPPRSRYIAEKGVDALAERGKWLLMMLVPVWRKGLVWQNPRRVSGKYVV